MFSVHLSDVAPCRSSLCSRYLILTLTQNLHLHDDDDENNDFDCALHINAENAVAVSR